MRIAGRQKLFPLARSEGLLIEELDSEMVIFDEQRKQAHCLTPLAAVIFKSCDGHTPLSGLARVASERLGESVSEGKVDTALAQLQERRLLASAPAIGISRRDVIQKGVALGAAAAATTMIFTVDPPMAQAAASCESVNSCSRDSQCSRLPGCAPSFQCVCEGPTVGCACEPF